jgi:AcrR family transcriptional regulator
MSDLQEDISHDSIDDIRHKILDTAEELFSKKGFRGTSIRDITERANCNIASVNYHFHGKENLYIEIFRHHMNTIRNQRIDAIQNLLLEKGKNTTLEELIYGFSTAFLEPFLKKGSGQRLMELMMRERNDPHLPRHLFLEEIVQPVKTLMKKALLQTCQKQNRSSKKFTAVA